jgi:hypothetical protein
MATVNPLPPENEAKTTSLVYLPTVLIIGIAYGLYSVQFFT